MNFNIKAYIEMKIKNYEYDIHKIYDYITNLQNIIYDLKGQLELRMDIYREFNLKRITRMGRMRPQQLELNKQIENEIKHKLIEIDKYFGLTEETIEDNTENSCNYPKWYFNPKE